MQIERAIERVQQIPDDSELVKTSLPAIEWSLVNNIVEEWKQVYLAAKHFGYNTYLQEACGIPQVGYRLFLEALLKYHSEPKPEHQSFNF